MVGVILVVAPGISLYALTLVLGIWLVVFGVMAAIRSLQIRSAASALESRAATA